jgi:hypothetical protein
MRVNDLTGAIIGTAEVHRALGPGLLESAYGGMFMPGVQSQTAQI